jgi:hypothetical protein
MVPPIRHSGRSKTRGMEIRSGTSRRWGTRRELNTKEQRETVDVIGIFHIFISFT